MQNNQNQLGKACAIGLIIVGLIQLIPILPKAFQVLDDAYQLTIGDKKPVEFEQVPEGEQK